ncbi:MAG: aspartate kinase [Fusobacteria bacterium]|nr:aspartate kinase [Fusobacteriota bacterium]
MGIIVQKYGGTSVGSPERIINVAERIIATKNKGNSVITVVSAMGDSTDELLDLAAQITRNPSSREMDMLLATGEQVSISLLSMAIKEKGYEVVSLTGAQAGIYTDTVHKKAKITRIDNTRLKREIEAGKIVIVAGFQGKTEGGEITTLGRGGSDTTAVAVAAAVKADVCEIYTDVDGVYTADPRIVPNASKLDFVSYDEMLELASLGALVLQTRAVEYAKQHKVRVAVKSSFNNNEGTIVEEGSAMERVRLVSGVAHDLNVAKITIYGVPDVPGIAGSLFRALADNNINVDMIVQSNPRGTINDISFTVSQEEQKKAVQVVEKIKEEVNAEGINTRDKLAKISIVGAGMQSNPGVAATMFEALANAGINIELISTSEIKVSCIVDAANAKDAVKIIHDKFKLGDKNK